MTEVTDCLALDFTTLTARFPEVSSEFIGRLLASCELAAFDLELAVERYLEKNPTEYNRPTPELLATHRNSALQNSRGFPHRG